MIDFKVLEQLIRVQTDAGCSSGGRFGAQREQFDLRRPRWLVERV